MRTHHEPQDQCFAFWQPDLSWWMSANSRLHNSFVAMGGAWQALVSRRMKEDLHLWQELAGAKTPQAMWSAYTNSWQKTVTDYWDQYATFTKLSGTLFEDMTAGQQTHEQQFPHAKAA